MIEIIKTIWNKLSKKQTIRSYNNEMLHQPFSRACSLFELFNSQSLYDFSEKYDSLSHIKIKENLKDILHIKAYLETNPLKFSKAMRTKYKEGLDLLSKLNNLVREIILATTSTEKKTKLVIEARGIFNKLMKNKNEILAQMEKEDHTLLGIFL